MFCRKCGTEIDTRYRNPDGSLECPKCGAVYMLRASSVAQTQSRRTQSVRREPSVRSSTARSRSTPPQRPRTTKPGIPKWFLGIIAVCLVALIISIITASGNPYAEQYKVIAKLEKAFNDKNLTAILECFEPSFSEYASEMAEMMGYDFDDLLNAGMFLNGLYSDGSGDVSNFHITIKPTSCEVNGDEAKVYVHETLKLGSGQSHTEDDSYNLVKVNGNWYIESE